MQLEDKEWDEVAQQMMREIRYDSGGVDRYHPEPTKWPKLHINQIANAAKAFFTAHPDLLNDENIALMCCGERGECEMRFGIYPEYSALDYALNEYHDPGSQDKADYQHFSKAK